MSSALAKMDKKRAYAWAKLYEAWNDNHNQDARQYVVLQRIADDVAIPTHIKDTLVAMATELRKKWDCPICVDIIPEGELEITNCGHFYCKSCLARWKQAEKDAGKPQWKCCSCNRHYAFAS